MAHFSELETEIKQLIIDSLMLEDIHAADIDSEAPLFIEGLGLDSIDALSSWRWLCKSVSVCKFKTTRTRTVRFSRR